MCGGGGGGKCHTEYLNTMDKQIYFKKNRIRV